MTRTQIRQEEIGNTRNVLLISKLWNEVVNKLIFQHFIR